MKNHLFCLLLAGSAMLLTELCCRWCRSCQNMLGSGLQETMRSCTHRYAMAQETQTENYILIYFCLHNSLKASVILCSLYASLTIQF